jgi:CBS domain-containing protein
MKVRSVLASRKRDVVTIRPEQTVREAVRLLAEQRIGALVVTDPGGAIHGILSERDVIRTAAGDDGVLDRAVGDVMTRRVVVGSPSDDLIAVANTMLERRFRHLPIVEEGRLIGMISIGDVLKTQRDAYRGEVDTLETQILAQEEE